MSKLMRMDFDNIDIKTLEEILKNKESTLDDIKTVIKVKQTPTVVSKTGKVYYKSAWDSTKKYYQDNKERLNQKIKDRYKNDEDYRIKSLLKSRLRYYMKKRMNNNNNNNNKQVQVSSEYSDQKEDEYEDEDIETIDISSDSDNSDSDEELIEC